MKKSFIKKLMSGVVALTLTFGVGVTAAEGKYKYDDFGNVLNIQGRLTDTPYGYYQVSDFNTFMDMGSWHGYTLPTLENKEVLGGFAGPTILFEASAETIAINLSDCFGKIKVKKNGEEFPLSGAKPTIQAYPGKLVQTYEFKGNFKLNIELIFTTDRTALVKTQITNLGNEIAEFEIEWSGKVFDSYTHGKKTYKINPQLEKTNEGVTVNFTGENERLSENTKNNKFVFKHSQDVETTISEDKKSYVTKLKNKVALEKGLPYTIYRTETFVFNNEELLEEDAKIKNINSNPERYFADNTVRWQQYIDNTVGGDKEVNKAYKNVAIKSMITLMTNWRGPAGAIEHSGITPSVSYRWFNGLWAWDSWKNAVAVAGFDTELAKDAVRTMFDYQIQPDDKERPQDAGAIIDAIYYQESSFNKRNSKPPLAAWVVYNIYKKDNDLEFVKEMYPKLQAYHEWWYKNRDTDQNGIVEYGAMVHDAHYKQDEKGNIIKDNKGKPMVDSDAVIEAAAWESGMDNAVRFDKDGIGEGDKGVLVYENKNSKGEVVGYSINQESVDLNAYLYAEKGFLKSLAEALGKTEDAKRYEKEAKEIADYVNKYMFDKTTGFYYDLQIDQTGKEKKLLVNRGMGTEGWLPLWAKMAPVDKAKMVVDNIMDENKFNLKVPFPTASKDNPRFEASKYWRGPVWLDQALYGVEALENYGYKEEAKYMAYKLFDNAEGVLTSNPINENYNPVTGEALHAKNFSWSAAAYYLLYKNTLRSGENTTQVGIPVQK